MGGKVYCVICSNCKGKKVEGRSVTLHRIPAKKELQRVWRARLKLVRKDLDSFKDHTRVCSEHFVNRKGPQPGDDIPSIFPNKIFKTTTLLDEQVQEDDITEVAMETNDTDCEEINNSFPAPTWYCAHPDWIPTVNLSLAPKRPIHLARKDVGACCAISCQNAGNKESSSEKTLFTFPRERERCRKWVENVQRPDLLRLHHSTIHIRKFVLCSDHFRENQFVHNTGRSQLVHDAVPTLFAMPETSSEDPVDGSDDALDSLSGAGDGPPVLAEGCLWPAIDHTYCRPYLKVKNLEKPDGVMAKARGKKSGSRKKEAAHSATTKREGVASKRKAEPALEKSKNGAKKSRVYVKIDGGKTKQVCCAEGCQTGRRKSNKSLFVFPVHKARCSEWLQNLGRHDLLEKSPHLLRAEGYRVCSDHFDADHFRRVRQRVQLTRSAVPTLMKPGEKQSQKTKPAAEKRRQPPPARQKKSRSRGQPEKIQIKVEIDWAEDPLLHCSSQVLSFSGNTEEHMMLPSDAHSALDTSSNPEILNNIKLEPVEAGEEMEYIKSEPIEEEETPFAGDHERSVDSAWHRSIGYGEPHSGDDQSTSLLPRCVGDIKTEPDSDDERTESADSDQDTDMVGNRLGSCSYSEQVQWDHFDSEHMTSSGAMNSSEAGGNVKQVSGNEMFASKVVEENDLDMSYTVVKVEPESDTEES